MLELIKDIQGLYIFNEPSVDMIGCIAIDKCKDNYTAIGGTRLIQYSSLQEMVEDAVNLAKAMSKKCKIANIPFTGGKSVIMKPTKIQDTQSFFECYGTIINSLNGAFVTGCDVGVNNHNMNIARTRTHHITGLSEGLDCDYLSYLTALGVFESMKICLKRLYNIHSLKNIHVVVQGVGKVGKCLVELLHKAEAQITISDINIKIINQLTSSIPCKVVKDKDLINTRCDIFAPCALGGVINEYNIELLKCKIICGAANNQIYDYRLLNILDKGNIIFVPDWICNIGGTVYAALSYLGNDVNYIKMKVQNIITKRTNEFLDLSFKLGLYSAAQSIKLK